MRIENFRSFDQIRFECFDSSNFTYNIFFVPKKSLVLDSSLKFNLNEPFKPEFNLLPDEIKISFYNLKGFDHTGDTFGRLLNFYDEITISLFYSNFKIYTHGSLAKDCSKADHPNFTYFPNVTYLFFTFSNKYHPNTCPQVFKFVNMKKLTFHGISDSFLKKNMLGFLQVNSTIPNEIDSINIGCYRAGIQKTLLMPQMLQSLKIVEIFGSVDFIGDDAFKHLTSLSLISLKVDNFRYFCTKGFGWLSNVKANVHLYLNFDNDEQFVFADTDICLFKDFLVKDHNLVYITDMASECSCTLMWIYQHLLENMTYLDTKYNSEEILYKKFYKYSKVCAVVGHDSFKKCDFESKFDRCKVNTSRILKIDDLIYLSEYFNFFYILFNSMFSILGIVTNSVSIVVSICLLKSNIFKKSLFVNQLILLNSTANFFLFLLNILQLMNKCVYYNGIFCSKIARDYYTQLFAIIFGDFSTNILKFISNISLIVLSLIRLESLMNRTKIIEKIEIKKFIFFLVFVGIFLSIDKLVSVRINEDYFVQSEKYYQEFPNSNTFQLSFQRVDYFAVRFKYNGSITLIFYIFFMTNFIINDFLLLVFTIAIDSVLLNVLRKNIKQKSTISNLMGDRKIQNKYSTEKRETKITTLIILNIFILILAKLFHLGISVFYLIKKFHWKKKENICASNSRICSNFQDFGEMIYNFSNMYTLYLFLNLNNNFKTMFLNSLKIFKRQQTATQS
ncbi:hypothetical protein BpHYR1_036906 [Brachionus plicatilis]|uniref:Uncharacterized protein n=1 Tax=Brachionus plicatilis TaxID=10195 RepID=A0A3M7RUL7_BRAPC|nr:hypothetical protein BpHYR1_036906 [Brachionus plicatilis]